MEPTFVLLTDLSAAAEVASNYTSRLATLVGAQLVLLHVYQDPLLEPEAAMMAVPAIAANRRQAMTELVERAQHLAVPAKAELSIDSLGVAVANAVEQYHPLLLAVGREAPRTMLDRLVANLALPVLRDARYPLLVVPEAWPGASLPRRVVVAADDQGFWLTAPALALAPLLGALQPRTTVVHVAPGRGPSQASAGLQSVARTGLFGQLSGNDLYEVREEAPVPGLLHATAELGAELVVVVARPHTLFGGMFHRSVTAELMRRSPVPVLVLPTMA